ncbi:MAG TPA: DUF4238 domain-containing protein [Methylomirabilota bacterium]|jgi:hypothetical protein|nr:DUF4238 domain-containing protein [Methylomirabilota bacterium]
MSDEARRRLVPDSFLSRFADGAGRLMAERRDRNRRLLLSVEEATAMAGFYEVAGSGAEPRNLARQLDRIEVRAADVIGQMLEGAFPPVGENRAYLALFVAFQLQLGRGHRETLARTAELLTELIVANLRERPEAVEDAGEGTPETAGPEDAHVTVSGSEPSPRTLSSGPRLAHLLSARTWQLVRFSSRQLLTGDTPVVLWSRPGLAGAYRSGLGAADEVRVPLDPRHALIMARKAPAGEVIRELDERHARALNRTVAEGAHEWMYYHPESDPMERVELAPP